MKKEVLEIGINALNNFKFKEKILMNGYPRHSSANNGVSFTLVQNDIHFKKVLHLRNDVFVKEEGYPFNAIFNKFDRDGFHFIAHYKNLLAGCVSVYFDTGDGSPIDNFNGLRLENRGDFKKAEVQKLAVASPYRKGYIPVALMVICYEFIKLAGYEIIYVFTLKTKSENIALYEKFGFKQFAEIDLFGNTKAVCMVLNLKEGNIYEKLSAKNERRKRFINKLTSNFSLNLNEEYYKNFAVNL